MSERVKVTVCAITYNHEKYIRKALESFVSQKTNFKYEVIIHDDASTDLTPEIIREFEKKYPDIIKPIYQKENQYSKKIPIILNYIFPRVKGEYIAFCECDDYWTDDYKLQKQYDIMESKPNISLCTHKVQCVNEDGTHNDKVFPTETINTGVISSEEFAELFFIRSSYPFHTCSYFIKKELLENVAYRNLNMNGDEKVLLSALNEGDLYYINKPMSCRRMMSKGSYNSNLIKKSVEERIQLVINSMFERQKFDILSGYKFHDEINICIINNIYSLMRKHNSKDVLCAFRKIEQELRYHFGKSLKCDIKYILIKYFPGIFNMIKR